MINKEHSQIIRELNNQSGFLSIIQWVNKNGDFLSKRKPWDRFGLRNFKVKITYLSVSYNENISNKYSAPRGKSTNFHNDPNLPTRYPGWIGHIEWQTNQNWPTYGSDLFRGTGINIGAGSGTSRNLYGYNVIFWEDDWPNLQKQRMINLLKINSNMDYFSYGDPSHFVEETA